MNIGLTYDLRADYLAMGYSEEETAEFDRPDTIEAIEGALHSLGHKTERVGHIKALVQKLAAGTRWDFVFNIAEGMHGVAREAQVPALLDAYEIPYTFSDPLVSALTLDKAATKRIVRDLGLPTTAFHLIESEADIARIDLPFPLFTKPLAEGTAKGVDGRSKVNTPAELAANCRRLLRDFRQPVLVEPFLPGREVTVSIVGTGDAAEALGTLEVVLLKDAEPDAYSYVNKERCEELVRYDLIRDDLSREAERLSLAVWRGLGCRDAGRVDLRADAAGRLQFLEVNPLSGMHPEHSDLPILCTKVGISYLELIRRIVASASQRIVARPAASAAPNRSPHRAASCRS